MNSPHEAGRPEGPVQRGFPEYRVFLGVLLAFVASCSEPAEAEDAPRSEAQHRSGGAPSASVDMLRIASWNLQWLHRLDGVGQVRRQPRDYELLRAYADQLQADVIALQEVDGEAAARRVFDPRRYAFHMSARHNSQRTGFVFRRDLPVRIYPDLRALDVGGVRHGTQIGVVLGNSELRLLNVHLKSGCWGDSLSKTSKACVKLARQVPVLEDWIDERARAGAPFVVLGDFNRRFDMPTDSFWPELDDGVPAGLALHRVTAGRRSACWGGKYPRYIDHIVLDGRARRWLVPGSFRQQQYRSGDHGRRKKLSDHCPIAVDLALAPGSVMARSRADVLLEPSAAPASARSRPAGPSAGPSTPGRQVEVVIKGNISRKGRRLYHLPGCPQYGRTRIDTDKGERNFSSEAEALAAGWQKASGCP